MSKKILFLPLLFFSLSVSAADQFLILDDYASGLSSKWKTKSFQGETSYSVQRADDKPFIFARSSSSASGLHYDIEYDPKEYPLLSWSWKVDNVIKKGDAHTKEGDDYAARIYVVFPQFLFWKTKALNYVWANTLKKNQSLPNAYTSNAMMIALESGTEKTGAWVTEQRDIVADYRQAFGSEPPNVGSIAIMTDTDNTGETATASYGIIRIHKK